MSSDGERQDIVHYDQLFPGRFMKAGEFLGKDLTMTMANIVLEDLPQDKGGDKTRGIIGFRETKKALVLNRTNGECIKAMFGDVPKNWPSHKVTFYPTMAKFGKEDVLSIRVRGSPELTAELRVEIKLPRRRPVVVTLIPTGKGVARPAAPAPAAATAPDEDSGDILG